MSDAIKSLDLKDGNVLEIHYDESAENPRRAWDNLTIMAVFHNRYDFGDKVDFSSRDFNSWSEMEEHIRKTYKPLAMKPLYMYEHTGITISTTPFGDIWDSGQIGFVYITQKKLDEMEISINEGESWSEFVKRLESYIDSEVEIEDQYLRGDVYGFIIKDAENNHVDSCWGFYGNNFKENGILDYVDRDNIVNIDDL
jgi:hypothetical protein